MTTLTAKKYSIADLTRYFETIGIGFRNLVKSVKVGSVLCVVYIGQWGIASRFVSLAKLAKTKMERTIDRAKDVVFIDGTNITTHGHTVCLNALNCTCEAFANGDHVVYILDHKICKHLIAKAKQCGLNTLNKLTEFIAINN